MGSGDILEEITMIDAFETSGTSPSTGDHESAPQGLIPTQFNRPLPRKPPAKRLFSGMAGSPLAVIGKPATPAPRKRGRPPKNTVAMTPAERKAASRTNQKAKQDDVERRKLIAEIL